MTPRNRLASAVLVLDDEQVTALAVLAERIAAPRRRVCVALDTPAALVASRRRSPARVAQGPARWLSERDADERMVGYERAQE